MGGSVWVDSEVGRGSCFGFRLTLPVAETAAADVGPPITLHHALVVDDQFINRTILDRQLTTAGIKATLARSGGEALAALAAGLVVDVILTDHDMPDMDGLAFAAAVRAAGGTMPIVLLSSNPGVARDRAAEAGLAAILQKPVLRSDLFRHLAALSAPPEPVAPPPPVPLRRMRVLAAEDNRTNQLVLRKMVRDLNIDLDFANNGREAV